MSSDAAVVRAIFDDTLAAHRRFADERVDATVAAADAIVRSLKAGGQLLAFGNGGSAADAQHLVAELVGRFEKDRRPYAAVALTADSSVLTTIGNDYGYEQIFARQIAGLGRRGDIAFGISTSGKSRNVEVALDAARAAGILTIALTGRDGGPIGANADIHLNVAESSTARTQEVHRTILHALCAIVENRLP
ncbi:MAG TPA: SIS domain-containing protein [Vicinamibacterales bacterium]